MTPRESATDRLIIRAVEQRLAKLDALIDAMEALNVAQQEMDDALAQRCGLLEHRIAMLEEDMLDRWQRGNRDAG